MKAGDLIGVVGDEKLALQLQATDARIKALQAQLDNAKVDVERSQALISRGAETQSRLDQLRTAVNVFTHQLEASKAERAVIVSQLSDDVLWSHPFLFPRFSPEIRPSFKGTPNSVQRRYLNPIPLSFEEQEAPFQQALHAPYLEEQQSHDAHDVPTIQMQTYSRSGGRGGKGRSSRASADVDADGAVVTAAVAAAMRQREPRENSDFLRVVVLEMNMRREGKLETGRAKICLPPRQTAESDAVVQGKVPQRWIGVSA